MNALETATLIGISPLNFWDLTPFEFNLMVKSYSSKMEADHHEKITLTYVNALWTAQWMAGKSRPPSLDKLLNTDISKKEMSDEQMLERVKQLNAIFGGEVRTIGS
ncbi:hypothetical protein [Bacillus sp. JJ1474]|uniref:hypothetical protein n=1 Tax=Bacillus sp. JJ1474 TaxID=3122955 RepID=UPI003000B59A